MKTKTLWLTRTAAMLALLIVLQWVTKPLGQYITGSCVNAVLAITCLFAGMSSGIVVALLSPVFACLLGIAPNVVTVPAIMVGNTVYVVVLSILSKNGRSIARRIAGLILASLAKFATLYVLVVVITCGPASGVLMGAGILKAPMLKLLPATFSWPQLITALTGGTIALPIVPVLKKALNKKEN